MFRRLRIIVPTALLIMILMRLVWVQLRSYSFTISQRSVISAAVLYEATGNPCILDFPLPSSYPLDIIDSLNIEELILGGGAWLASPGSMATIKILCEAHMIAGSDQIRVNQWMMVGMVFLATLMIRCLTSSWAIALIGATVLLSRGHLLAEIGHISIDHLLTIILVGWFTAAFHFLRTASYISLSTMFLLTALGTLVDICFLALGFSFPILLMLGFLFRRPLSRPVFTRLRELNRRLRKFRLFSSDWNEERIGFLPRTLSALRWMVGVDFPPPPKSVSSTKEQKRGSLIRTLDLPFGIWAYANQRWLKLSLGFLLTAALAFAISLTCYYFIFLKIFDDVSFVRRDLLFQIPQILRPEAWLQNWWSVNYQVMDYHLLLSVGLMLICAVQSPADGLISFFEAIWLTLVVTTSLLVSTMLVDWVDYLTIETIKSSGNMPVVYQLPSRTFLNWLEPVLLSLGVASVYNLLKVQDSRRWRQGNYPT